MFLLFGFLINILFLNFNNPLILGILMLIQTFNLILMMGKIYYSFWFSYIIFLVFIGGLFILFIYMITLNFNNKIYIFMNYKWLMFFILLIFLMIFIIKDLIFFNNYENNNLMNFKNKEYNLNLIKLYNVPNNLINILLINYLLLLMIIVVKVTNYYSGPLKIN